jgi:hypothetical protein
MRFIIDEVISENYSPRKIKEMKNNLVDIFTEIHKIKDWKWEISEETMQICIRVGRSYQDSSQDTDPTIWIALIWANKKGSTRSPECDREIFISKATANKSSDSQNVYTYHSYSDLIQKYNSGNLKNIIK